MLPLATCLCGHQGSWGLHPVWVWTHGSCCFLLALGKVEPTVAQLLLNLLLCEKKLIVGILCLSVVLKRLWVIIRHLVSHPVGELSLARQSWSETGICALHLKTNWALSVIGDLKTFLWEGASRSLRVWTPLGNNNNQKGVETKEDPGGDGRLEWTASGCHRLHQAASLPVRPPGRWGSA